MKMNRLTISNSIFKLFVIPYLFLISCGGTNQNQDSKNQIKSKSDSILKIQNMTENLDRNIKTKSDKFFTLDKVVVILSQELDEKSNLINIQDYVENGKSFIPVFSTQEKFKESTKGADLGKKIIGINPYLLLSVLSGKETLRINPTLSDETYFNASDLKQIYKSEIESFLAKLPK